MSHKSTKWKARWYMRANGLPNMRKGGQKDITKVTTDFRDYANEPKTSEFWKNQDSSATCFCVIKYVFSLISFGMLVGFTFLQATKTLRESRGVALLCFSTSVLEGSEGSASRPTAFYPRERLSTHCTGGWVVPRAGLDSSGKSRPHRDSIPGQFSPYPVAIPTELPGPREFW
jgi:hypothetical protein